MMKKGEGCACSGGVVSLGHGACSLVFGGSVKADGKGDGDAFLFLLARSRYPKIENVICFVCICVCVCSSVGYASTAVLVHGSSEGELYVCLVLIQCRRVGKIASLLPLAKTFLAGQTPSTTEF